MQNKSRTIAKNTLLLTFRMLFLLIVNLYTSRILLESLGIEDFGIYNVVGGVVAMFSIVSGSITASVGRYITFELGENDFNKLSKVFSTSVIIQFILSAVLLLLLETVGLWFLNTQMNIAMDRMFAANWVFQLSIITFCINLISVPYNALIIAHEKMGVFAYISVLDGVSKLIIAYAIALSTIDRLIFYAILLCLLSLLIRLIYTIYCNRKFPESRVNWHLDFTFLKSMFGFAGWNFIGATAGILRDQGGNVLLNIFFGPTVNASRAIALQVSTAVQGFVSSFTTSLNPQITKSYASGDSAFLNAILLKGSKFSFFILFSLAFPILLSTDYIIQIWLGEIPTHSVAFVRLTLILSLVETISMPLITAMLATGKIKKYQIIVGGINMLNLPISLVFLWLGSSPESVFVISIILSCLCLYARLGLLKSMIGLNLVCYFKEVILSIVYVVLFTVVLTFLLTFFLNKETLCGFLFTTIISMVITLCTIYLMGLTQSEKEKVITYLHKIQNRIKF